jgi:hypothetical protein
MPAKSSNLSARVHQVAAFGRALLAEGQTATRGQVFISLDSEIGLKGCPLGFG